MRNVQEAIFGSLLLIAEELKPSIVSSSTLLRFLDEYLSCAPTSVAVTTGLGRKAPARGGTPPHAALGSDRSTKVSLAIPFSPGPPQRQDTPFPILSHRSRDDTQAPKPCALQQTIHSQHPATMRPCRVRRHPPPRIKHGTDALLVLHAHPIPLVVRQLLLQARVDRTQHIQNRDCPSVDVTISSAKAGAAPGIPDDCDGPWFWKEAAGDNKRVERRSRCGLSKFGLG